MMNYLYPISYLIRKLASGLETEYLTPQELELTLNTPDDPTILNLYKDAQSKATRGVAAALFTPLPKISWATYQDPHIRDYITTKRFKYAFQLNNTTYVNLNIKILQQNLPSVPASLFEICTHEVAHSLYNHVHTGLSIPIDNESFADIVTKYVAPRTTFSGASAPKQFAQLQSILNDLRP